MKGLSDNSPFTRNNSASTGIEPVLTGRSGLVDRDVDFPAGTFEFL